MLGEYISGDCRPTDSEKLLFDYMVHHRKTVTIREAAVELFGQTDVQLFGNDKNFVSVLKVMLKQLHMYIRVAIHNSNICLRSEDFTL